MATTDKESSVAGTDNHPPMLVESDYESWKIRIERYIHVTEGQGAVVVQVTRDKTDEEFTKIENNRELADIQATNILSQGLPRHFFNILNQMRNGKEIWDNVELLMKGSGKSLQQKKEELFDEYERFRAIGNESIPDYFVHFHKLINDIKITQLNIPAHQMNAKFVNNLPPYWAKNSDVDEGPHAAAAFMANLSSTSGTNGATTSHVNEVHTDDNQIFDNVNHLLAHEMHREEHLDSDVESDIDDNTIPYHQYQLDSEVQDVPTKSNLSQKVESINSLKTESKKVLSEKKDLEESEESLVQAEVSRIKMSSRPGKINLINYAELNALYSHFVPQKELSREQVYWLPAEELATQKSNPPKPVTSFVHTRLAPSKINNMSMLNVEHTVGSFDKQALETELTQLKDAITSVRIQNDRFKVEKVNLKRRYQELSTSNSYSRDMLTRKITALTVENAKLKSKTISKMHSKPIVPEKPKVLAPGMYAISSKYIVPPRRYNRAEPTPLPKKKQATFQELPRPSNRPTQKTVVQQNKKPNIYVNLSIRVKPATGASKPMSKSDTQNHSTFLAKRAKARRVEDHHRNLNKQNHVDSRLNVKRTGFVSNSDTVSMH
nr:hypothetical protein [Tanacetum cinerariifolium]